MNLPKISIVTICFNNEQDIRHTIESVINQTYKNIEYIIIDGASTDSSLDIIYEYKKNIYKIISEPDKNLYDAINKGIRIASGDIIGLIHAGDKLYNSKVIEKIANHFMTNDIDIIYGHSILVNKEGIPVRINKSPAYRKTRIRRGWMPSHQSIYLKTKLINEVGDYNIDLHPSSDYEFFLRYFYFNDFKIKRLDEFIIKFAIGGRSTRNYLNNLKAQRQHIQCWIVNGEKPPITLIPLKLMRKPIQFIRAALLKKR